MVNKRNIVIKVKYPVPGKTAGSRSPAPQMITKWNVKRILLAASALALVLASFIYVIKNDPQEITPDNSAALTNAIEEPVTAQIDIKEADTLPKQEIKKTNFSVNSINEPNKKNKQATDIAKNAIKKQLNKKVINVIKGPEYSKVIHNVSRASLTYGINNKEPAGEVARTVDIKRKKPVWIYYFTELKAMNGGTVFHEWLKNGAIVSRQKLVISGDIWRTSSRKLLSESEKGSWIVRLVDKSGRLLNEKSFKVE